MVECEWSESTVDSWDLVDECNRIEGMQKHIFAIFAPTTPLSNKWRILARKPKDARLVIVQDDKNGAWFEFPGDPPNITRIYIPFGLSGTIRVAGKRYTVAAHQNDGFIIGRLDD